MMSRFNIGGLTQFARKKSSKSKSPEEVWSGQFDPEADHLTLWVSDSSWMAWIGDIDDEAPACLTSSSDLMLRGASMPDVLKDCLEALPASVVQSGGPIRLVISDNGFDIADNRMMRLRSDEMDRIRDYAIQQVGSEDVAFAVIPFGESSEDELERQVIVTATMDLIRPCLVALGRLSLRVSHVTTSTSTIFETLRNSEASIACFVRSTARSTEFLFSNRVTGAVHRQIVEVGHLTLGQTLSRETGVSLEEAHQALSSRSLLPAAQAFLDDDFSSPSLLATTTAALRPAMQQLYDGIEEGLDFFAFQRLNGTPTQLVISGDFDQVKGLDDWIAEALGTEDIEVFEAEAVWQSLRSKDLPNLLTGAPRSVLKIGNTTYRYQGGRLRPNEEDGDALGRERTLQSSSSADDFEFRTRQNGLGRETAMVGALIVALCVGVWQMVQTPLMDSKRVSLNNYGNVVSQATRLTVSRVTKSQKSESAAQTQSSEVRWADKVSAIAGHLIDGMWITSISGGHRKTAAAAVEIEGFVRTENNKALAQINRFVRRLKADGTFMQDLSDVELAQTAEANGGNSLNFIVRAK